MVLDPRSVIPQAVWENPLLIMAFIGMVGCLIVLVRLIFCEPKRSDDQLEFPTQEVED